MEIHIYTDGSCTVQTGEGGWGAIIRAVENKKLLKERCISGGAKKTTNNQMELTAILKAVKEIKKGATQPIIIFTDSQLAIDWISKKNKSKDVKLKMLISQINHACTARNISPEYRKVKGHSGHHLNNKVDQLANSERLKVA
jgi:ribonuclease HI